MNKKIATDFRSSFPCVNQAISGSWKHGPGGCLTRRAASGFEIGGQYAKRSDSKIRRYF